MPSPHVELRCPMQILLLTQEQHCGVRCQLHADVHSLALSATDATHPLVTDLGVSDLVQTQQLQRLVHQLQLQKHRHRGNQSGKVQSGGSSRVDSRVMQQTHELEITKHTKTRGTFLSSLQELGRREKAQNRRFSSTVKFRIMMSSWGTKPTRDLYAFSGRSMPLIMACPAQQVPTGKRKQRVRSCK